MKKLLLVFAVVAILMPGCKKIEESIDALSDRIDTLEKVTIPSIEEQIESVNELIIELEEIDKYLEYKIKSLESDVESNSEDIYYLQKRSVSLDDKIAELQNYVDIEIQKMKDNASAAYATLEQFNSAKAELETLKQAIFTLGTKFEALDKKVADAIKSLNEQIADLQNRLARAEVNIENLLARIQSVSYVPQYSDGKALVTRIGAISEIELDFKVSPKECVAELEKVWSEALSCEAVYTKTRVVSLVKLTVTKFETDAENGIITVTASCENLSEEFFAGTQEASVALVISDGNNSVTSENIPMIADGIHHIYAKAIIGEDTRATYGEGLVATWEDGDQIALLQEHANYSKIFSIVNKLNIKEGLGTNTASFDGYILVNTSAPRVYHIAYPTSAVSFLTSSTPSLEGSISYKNSSPTSGYQLKAHGTYNYIYNSTLNITIPTTQNGKWEPYMYASTSEAVDSDAICTKVLTTLNGAIAVRAFEPDRVTPKQLKQITITSSNADIAGVFSGTAQSVGSLGEVVGDETAWHTSFEEASAQSKALASLESKVKTMTPATTTVTKTMSLSFVGGEKSITISGLESIPADSEGYYTYYINVAPATLAAGTLTIEAIDTNDATIAKTHPSDHTIKAGHCIGFIFAWSYE